MQHHHQQRQSSHLIEELMPGIAMLQLNVLKIDYCDNQKAFRKNKPSQG